MVMKGSGITGSRRDDTTLTSLPSFFIPHPSPSLRSTFLTLALDCWQRAHTKHLLLFKKNSIQPREGGSTGDLFHGSDRLMSNMNEIILLIHCFPGQPSQVSPKRGPLYHQPSSHHQEHFYHNAPHNLHTRFTPLEDTGPFPAPAKAFVRGLFSPLR